MKIFSIFLSALFLLASYCLFIPTLTIQETEKTVLYDVSGLSADTLKAQIKDGGPNGYIGHTKWHVKWNWLCHVSLHTVFTMPRHVNIDKLSARDQDMWNSLIFNLWLHERAHQNNGRQAAKTISHQRCFFTDTALARWQLQDKLYDIITQHGKTEGVVLQ